MAKKSKPLKPSVSLNAVVFTRDGRVYKENESLPRSQREADKWAVDHFLMAVKESFAISLCYIAQEDEPADVVCQTISGQVVKIQVVEAVDLLTRQLQERRESYALALADPDSGILSLFNGCRLSFSDKGKTPLLPPLKTKQGINALEEIKDCLRKFAKELAKLKTGKMYLRHWAIGREEVEVYLSCEYHFPTSSTIIGSLNWGGYRLFNDPAEQILFIEKAIEGKISKNYAKPKEEFWLLVYGTDMPPFEIENDCRASRFLLSDNKHPFDKVWFLYTFVGSQGGSLRLIWEREKSQDALPTNSPEG